MHGPILRSGRLMSLIGPYLRTLVPAAVCILALVGLCEVLRHVQDAAVGEESMTLYGITFDSGAPAPWAVLGVLAIGGFWLARRAAPALQGAWDEATFRP